MRAAAVLIGALVTLVFAPTLAQATSYCAGAPGGDCTGGTYPATGAGLQSALDAADLGVDIGGTADTVRIGPGTYASPTGFSTIGGDLSIVGSGASTILTSTDTGGPETPVVLRVKAGGTPAASVRSLQVLLTSPLQAGGIFLFREVADVHIGGPGTLIDDAIALPDGGRVTRTRIDPAAFKDGIGIDATSGVIEDTFVRVHVNAPGDRANAVIGYGGPPVASRVLTLRHVTLLGDGPSTIGVIATVQQSNTEVVTESIQIRDSVVHGFGLDLSRKGRAGDPRPGCKSLCFDGVTSIDAGYSSLAVTPSEQSGPGAITVGPGVLSDPEPGLQADGTILAGSPLINAGDPAGPEAGDSATDLAGHERIQVGRRDIGALESPFAPAPPPVTPIVPGGSAPVRRAPVISALTLSHRRFKVGGLPRRGTTVRLRLSAPAALTLRVDRVLAGRKLVRRGKPTVCRVTPVPRAKARKAVSRGKPCRVYKQVGALKRAQVSGAVSVAFSGRFGRTALRTGAYRLTASAHDAAGAAAAPRRITFTISLSSLPARSSAHAAAEQLRASTAGPNRRAGSRLAGEQMAGARDQQRDEVGGVPERVGRNVTGLQRACGHDLPGHLGDQASRRRAAGGCRVRPGPLSATASRSVARRIVTSRSVAVGLLGDCIGPVIGLESRNGSAIPEPIIGPI